MGQLTEVEIFDCLTSNLRQAAEHCDDLAKSPRKGAIYDRLRKELKLVEGACRQAAFWRDGDSRWLVFGRLMAQCHEQAGEWLRGIKLAHGGRVRIAEGLLHPCFVKLAENLRAIEKQAADCKTKRTNHTGPILPVMQAAPHRDTRPVHITVPQSLRRQSGLIVPAGIAVNAG